MGFHDTVRRSGKTAAAAKPARTTGELPEWDLTHLYPGTDSPAFKGDLDRALVEAQALSAQYRGKLAELAARPDGSEALAAAVRHYEGLSDLLGRIGAYAGLVYAGDTTDPQRAKFYGDTQDRLNAAITELLFFELELNRIEPELMAKVAGQAPLSHWKPWLDDLARDKPHQLEDRIEALFHEKSMTGAAAWNRLFDETIASLRFTVDGEELTLELTLNKLQDSDGEVRRKAAEALSTVFRKELRIFALITNTLAKDKEISDRWRKFDDVADSRHLANRVEREVVDALVSAVREAYPRLSHRYYRLKAKWFGRDALDFWDRNAPLPQVEQRTIPWTEARETVLSAYAAFSPQMAAIAQRFFDERWIDAPTRPGKRPGAFCAYTVPSHHPYVLLNWTSRPRDVATLAHELGHGLHAYLAREQGVFHQSTPLTLAETASVFGEAVTNNALLTQLNDPGARFALLSSTLEDSIATVFRQVAMNRFEDSVHTARREEGELSVDRFNELWAASQEAMLGDSVELTDGYRTWWSYIPHFMGTPGYVYAYAYGQLLALSVYARYRERGDEFVPSYLELLRAGGSMSPGELGRIVDCDLEDPGFWDAGLDIVEAQLDAASEAATAAGRI
jgi:oligoendopeptidase F